MKRISLYDYQRRMLQQIEMLLARKSTHTFETKMGELRCQGLSVMVQMPTGTGKTYVMVATIQQAKIKGEVWIIAHRRELVEQIEHILNKFGMSYAEAKDVDKWPKEKIMVMSIQWLTRHIHKVKTTPSLIIIDEAHHAMAPSYHELWTLFPEARRIGFTATPCRMQATKFTTLFDELLQSWSIEHFIKEGRLSLYDYVVINRFSDEQHTIDSFEKRGADGDFQIKEMDEKMNRMPRIMRLYESVERYAHGKKGIVYAINIAHAKNIASYYSSHGLRAVAIDSKTPSLQRAQMVADFKEGRLDCLVNVNLFDEGFDCPDVEYIQMARPTLSLSKYMQMIGRGLRVHPDKKMCVLIDNVGLCRMFGLPNVVRDWQSMFEGGIAGRGHKNIVGNRLLRNVDNEMEVVANHSRLLPQSEEERERYLAAVEPFERDGRWGLRVGEDIILHPVYRRITPFVGRYSAFELAQGRWGVLLRDGKQYIDAIFKEVELLPDGDAILIRSEISRRRVHLDTTLSDKADIIEWWGVEKANLWNFFHEF